MTQVLRNSIRVHGADIFSFRFMPVHVTIREVKALFTWDTLIVYVFVRCAGVEPGSTLVQRSKKRDHS